MPWVVRKTGPPSEPFCVFKEDEDGEPTGKTLGCHPTRAEADRQLAALYANVPDAAKACNLTFDSFDLGASPGARIWLGDPVKSLGENRLGGYLVRFGSADEPDQSSERDFFTRSTDFGHDDWPVTVPVLIHHGLLPGVGVHRIGSAKMTLDDDGIFVEAMLKAHDEWARRVLRTMQRKSSVSGTAPLRWSSGSADHLVRRDAVKSSSGEVSHWLRSWFIAEASLTPTPAEHRCNAYALKSLPLPDLDFFDAEPLSFQDEAQQLARANLSFFERAESRLEARIKTGRQLSAANRDEIASWLDSLNPFDPLRARINDLLARVVPAGGSEARGDLSLAATAGAAQGTKPAPAPGAGPSVVTHPAAGVLLPDLSDLFTSMASRVGNA